MTEVVYLAPTRTRREVFHTDASCNRLQCDDGEIVTRQRGPLENYGYRCCQICNGGREYQGGHSEDSRTPLRHYVDDIDTEVPSDD